MKHNDKTPEIKRDRLANPDAPHPLETLAARLAAEDIGSADETREDAWAHGVRLALDGQLAALRRQLTPSQPVKRKPTRVSPELQALGREALLARLASLEQAPEVQIAHLELSGLSDSDLRQLIAEIENVDRTR